MMSGFDDGGVREDHGSSGVEDLAELSLCHMNMKGHEQMPLTIWCLARQAQRGASGIARPASGSAGSSSSPLTRRLSAYIPSSSL